MGSGKQHLLGAGIVLLTSLCLTSCDNAPEFEQDPAQGVTSLSQAQGLYSGVTKHYYESVTKNGEDTIVSDTILNTIIATAANNSNMNFKIYHTSLLWKKWITPGVVEELNDAMKFDGDKIAGDEYSTIRGARLSIIKEYPNGKLIDGRVCVKETYDGFRQKTYQLTDEIKLNSTQDHPGIFYSYTIDCTTDDEYNNMRAAISQNPDTELINWESQPANLRFFMQSFKPNVGGPNTTDAYFHTGKITMEIRNANTNLFIWNSNPTSINGGNEPAKLENGEHYLKLGDISVQRDGTIKMKKKFSYHTEPDVPGGTITGMYFEGTIAE